MASRGHDLIVKMIQIKMNKMGYETVFLENRIKGTIDFELPPTIISHRPDIVGYRRSDNMVCIGEAKYFGDLSSERTKRQIKDFIDLSKNNEKIDLIFGIPLSEKDHFMRIIKDMHDDFEFDEKVLLVPDRLIGDD